MISLLSEQGTLGKGVSIFIGMCFSYFAPISDLVIISVVFILIDFIVGVWASRVRAKRSGGLSKWGFESSKMWHTIYKLVFVVVGIVMAWLLDERVITLFDIKLANLFCGFICACEFWSFLENAAIISNHPLFRWLRKFMSDKVTDVFKIDPEAVSKASKGESPEEK